MMCSRTCHLVITPLISYTKRTRQLVITPLVSYTKGTRHLPFIITNFTYSSDLIISNKIKIKISSLNRTEIKYKQ
jgi:hypothetical protein